MLFLWQHVFGTFSTLPGRALSEDRVSWGGLPPGVSCMAPSQWLNCSHYIKGLSYIIHWEKDVEFGLELVCSFLLWTTSCLTSVRVGYVPFILTLGIPFLCLSLGKLSKQGQRSCGQLFKAWSDTSWGIFFGTWLTYQQSKFRIIAWNFKIERKKQELIANHPFNSWMHNLWRKVLSS